MADSKSTANSSSSSASKNSPVAQAAKQVKKRSSNTISWLAPLLCLIAGYCIWRFGLGDASHFEVAKGNGFWPEREGPKKAIYAMYLGGIIVPLLIALFLMVIVFSIERLLTISKAKGKGNAEQFVMQVQFLLANRNVDGAIALCDKQQGSVGNVMRAGLVKYKEMIVNTELDTEEKVQMIQNEVAEATSLELPMLQRNMVFISTIASIATLFGLLGTVLGMIRSFAALGEQDGGGGAGTAAKLSQGISEALYNTALGIGTSALAIIMYNWLNTMIDGITYNIDEAGYTLSESFEELYH